MGEYAIHADYDERTVVVQRTCLAEMALAS